MSDQDIMGTGWSFPVSFKSLASGPKMTSGEVLIEQSISILLNTLLGERALHNKYGSRLSNFNFDSIDVAVLADLKEEIANAILLNEPRVNLKEIYFDNGDIYEGLLKIELEYKVKLTNSRWNMVFPYYLNGTSF